MKIGILTYQRAENYGALLQAYALKTYLQCKGHEISFVDYWPKYHVEHYRLFSIHRFKKMTISIKVKYLISLLLWGFPSFLRKYRLTRFMHHELCLDKTIKYQNDNDSTEKYDVVIYGSDQIWRRQDIHNNEYNPWYFGSANIVAAKKITYAASMGIINPDEKEIGLMTKWLKAFNYLSVREKDLQLFLHQIGFESYLVIDPTFLLPKQEWKKLFKSRKEERYILFYNLLGTEDSIRFANGLSHATGLPIKEINMRYQLSHVFSKRYISCASIDRFLQLMEGAEYVVSNSFHGVAFSIIFEKQFWALGIGKKADRVLTLLDALGIKERYLFCKFDSSILTDLINYDEVRIKIQKLVSDSQKFLNNSIQ